MKAPVQSIVDQLKAIDADTDDILDVVKALVPDASQIVAMLQTLGTDLAFDESVTYQAVQQVLTAVQGVAAAVAAAQASANGQFAVVNATLATIQAELEGPPGPGPAASVTLSTQPSGGTTSMGTTITVDTTNELLVLAFDDDHNNVTTEPNDSTGAPAVLTGTSDTPTVLTVGTFALAADGTYQAPLVPAGLAGSATVGSTVQDSTGADIPLPAPAADGSTTFTAEAGTILITVNPGAPVGDRLSVST